jgi:hypothetical protein
MSHYDLTAWSDYVRGLLPQSTTEQMARHAGECTLCAYDANLLARTASTGFADRGFLPPVELVAAAEQILPSARRPVSLAAGASESVGFLAGLRRLPVSLQWDSFDGVVPAGVRSLKSDSRHLAYRAGRYAVDLWLDTDPSASSVTLTGQIADAREPDMPMPDMQALLLSGSHVLATTTTTEFGEFSLRAMPGPGLRLIMPVVPAGEYLEVALNFPEVHESC